MNKPGQNGIIKLRWGKIKQWDVNHRTLHILYIFISHFFKGKKDTKEFEVKTRNSYKWKICYGIHIVDSYKYQFNFRICFPISVYSSKTKLKLLCIKINPLKECHSNSIQNSSFILIRLKSKYSYCALKITLVNQ